MRQYYSISKLLWKEFIIEKQTKKDTSTYIEFWNRFDKQNIPVDLSLRIQNVDEILQESGAELRSRQVIATIMEQYLREMLESYIESLG